VEDLGINNIGEEMQAFCEKLNLVHEISCNFKGFTTSSFIGKK
jgi:hypothetical protein